MTTFNRARRAFFKQGLGPRATEHHVPWATAAFHDACQRCDACIIACETSILVRGDGGFPTADFARGGCTFCAACVAACRYDALMYRAGPPWQLKAQVNDRCLSAQGTSCRACGDHCEQQAIRFRLALGGRAFPQLDTALCNGCGDCVAVCPSHAIQMESAA